MKKIILLVFSLITICGTASAQQDCPQVDCPGICGRFVDGDGDGFCDHGQLSTPKSEPAKQEQPKTSKPNATPVSTKSAKQAKPAVKDTVTEEVPVVKQDCQEVDCTGKCGRFVDGDGDGFCDHGHLSKDEPQEPQQQEPIMEETKTEETSTPSEFPTYPVYLILGSTLLLYIISFILVKANVWTKVTHRKIWNIALSITFLVSCLLGLLLAIFLRHDYRPECYITLLHLHVWFGIAMTLIACFHALWHINYFKTIFKKNKNTNQ